MKRLIVWVAAAALAGCTCETRARQNTPQIMVLTAAGDPLTNVDFGKVQINTQGEQRVRPVGWSGRAAYHGGLDDGKLARDARVHAERTMQALVDEAPQPASTLACPKLLESMRGTERVAVADQKRCQLSDTVSGDRAHGHGACLPSVRSRSLIVQGSRDLGA